MPRGKVGFKLSGPLFDNPNLADDITNNFIEEMGGVIESKIMPKLADEVPVRTGRLKSGLTLRRTRRRIRVSYERGSYWPFQTALLRRQREIWTAGLKRYAPGAFRRAVKRALP